MRKWIAALSLLFISGWAVAAEVPNQGVIANETALAYGNTYYLDISQAKALSLQVTYTSSTVGAQIFTDGSVSTGNITVVSFAALSTATAHLTTIIYSSAGVNNNTLYIAGNNIPIRFDNTATSMTACNIAQDISAKTVFLSTCALGSASGIIYTTAPANGTFWNQFSIQSSTLAAISSGTFAGGQDNQTIKIGTVTLTANTDFYPLTNTNITAKAIASAINAKMTVVVSSVPTSTAVIYTTSTSVGTTSNFTVVSSSNAALSLSAPVSLSGSAGTGTMTGGTNSAETLGSAIISVPNHGFSLGMGVVYTTATTTALGGLSFGTTYFVVPAGANAFALASTVANAVIGTTITITSSNTAITAHSFVVSGSTTAGTPTMVWKVANDKANIVPFTVNSSSIPVTTLNMATYVAGGSTFVWDIGPIDYNWIAAVVNPPSLGAIQFKAIAGAK